jgi:hypothetical protein
VHPNLRAAEGWIELGNNDEAAGELHNCPPEVKSSIAFLKLWVRICEGERRWEDSERYCELLAKHAADDPFTVFHQTEAFHKQGRNREAFAALQYAPVKVKQGADFFYLMARVLCGLEEFTLALSCLGKAFDLNSGLRLKASDDPDLKRVWLDLQEG